MGLQKFLKSLGDNVKVICIGNVTYDITLPVDDFIEENVKYRINQKTECGGGPASNACFALGKWGIKPYFSGIIGNDELGKKIIDEFKSVDVNLKYLNVLDEYDTTTSIVINNKKNGSRTVLSYKPNNFKLKEIDDDFDYILVDGQEYEASYNLIKKNKNAISIIDAGRCTDNVINLAKICNYVVCSYEFAHKLTGVEDYNLMYEKLEEIFNGTIVVTLESAGSLARIDGIIKVIPSIKVDSIDSTGAGDIYHGAFVYGLIQKWSLEEIIRFSNIAGGLSVTKIGSRNSVFSLEEIYEYR